MTYVLIICLLYMFALVFAFVWRLKKADRKGRLEYIKSFKRGKFVLIYFVVLPLYYLAYRYNGKSVADSFWTAIKTSIDIVMLKYDYSAVEALLKSNLFYNIVLQMAFSLILVNTLLFTFSIWGQALMNMFSLLYTRFCARKVVVVVGYNPNSVDIIKSVTKKHGKAVLMDKASREMKDDALACRANYVDLSDGDLGEKLLRLFRKFNKKKVSVIVNCEDDRINIRYINQLYNLIEKEKLTDLPLTEEHGVQVYVFGSKENESTFVHYEEKSKGLIHFINRYKLIATDFISKYPLTQYMTEKQIDYQTATIKNDVDLNVVMIGFGNFNETLFTTSVSNNQFLTLDGNGKLQPKRVNYHLFDMEYPYGKITAENTSVHSKNLNHGYNRYAEFLKTADSKDYLELIDNPARVLLYPRDFAHPRFYASLKEVLGKDNAYTYIVVSFGTDMENLELAEKVVQKIREWQSPSFVKVFVKMHDQKMLKELRADFHNDYMQIFGTNQAVVYNAATILSEETELMAKLRHKIYIAENTKKKHEALEVSTADEVVEKKARDKWYNEYKQFQRESNVFASLSIRMKLQLLGYDFVDKQEEGDDCAAEFESKYEAGDKREPSDLTVEGKRIWNYCNDEQGRKSVRWNYAVQEHQRWCANMICNGIVPATRKQLAVKDGRIFDKRIHGNLTTMEGLIEYREIIAKLSGKSTEETDVIRYDYQLMDDVAWLLNRCNYKIIAKRQS